FWSSVGGKPYPISLRAQSFEQLYAMRDPAYTRAAGDTYARRLRHAVTGSSDDVGAPRASDLARMGSLFPVDGAADDEQVDVLANLERQAIEALRNDRQSIEKIESQEGAAWGAIKAFLLDQLPDHLDDSNQIAFRLVKKAMDHLYGRQDQGWEAYRHPVR